MTPILVIHDPAAIAPPDEYELPDGMTLADWILKHYGPDGFSVPTAVYDGGIAPDDLLPLDDFAAFNRAPVGPVFIVHRPQGVELLIYGAIAIVTAVAVALLLPVPDLSGTGNQRQQRRSPNNALAGQTNVARLLDRIPDIFGEVLSYPDLIAPTVSEFRGHIKYQTEYLCIGRGHYLLQDFKSGFTLIDAIAGSSVEVYEPGEAPAQVLKTRQSNEVSGQIMIGQNEEARVELTGADTVAYTAGVNDTAVINGTAGDFDAFDVGDVVELTNAFANNGSADFNLDGAYTVNTATGSVLTLEGVTTENANWAEFTSTPTAVLVTVGGETVEPVCSVPGKDSVIGPFVVPGGNNSEVWIDLEAPKGLAQGTDLDQTKTVNLTFAFRRLEDDGTPTQDVFNYPVTLSDNERDPRFWTFKVSAADGLVPGARYRVLGQRGTLTDPGTLTVLEEVRWSRLAGIEDITAPDTTGTTRAVIETRATQQVAALQERQFNVRATRKVVTWDGSQVVGNIETGEGLQPSRRFADAALHYILDDKLAARNISALNVDELYSIQGQLDSVFDGEKGEFSYTFDNLDSPALEELRLIVNAARAFLYRQGSQFSATRDEPQDIPRGLINRRSKIPDSETRTLRFNKPLGNDGVVIEYNDISDGETYVITLPDDLPADDENFGQPAALNPLRIDGAGIRQYAQAWDRAQYEYRKLIYNRVSVEQTATAESLLLPLNARVQHVDGTRLAALESDGEVLRVDRRNVYTSEPCVFEAGKTYSASLRSEDGSPTRPIPVTPLADGGCGFRLARGPGFPIYARGDKGYQRGTLYSFGPDGNELAQAFLVQRKTPDDEGNVRLEMINYAPEYYAADDRQPPPRG